MKKYLLLFFIIINLSTKAEFGVWASAVYINTNGVSQFYCTQLLAPNANAIGTTNFEDASLGSFVANTATLSIKGGEIKTFRDENGNVCSGKVFYTVYPQGARPVSPVFTEISLGYFCDCSGSTFNACGGGTCTDGRDQKWQTVNQSNDLTQLAAGDYVLELYYQISGHPTTNACTEVRFDSNLGANYKASFTITTNLAVNFSGLKASLINNSVALKWSIENDADIVRYEIERSANGINFAPIGSVASAQSDLLYNYSFTDNAILNGNNFYRIKFYNTDNTVSYSKISRIDFNKLGSVLSALPNQSTGTVSIRLNSIPSGRYNISVINNIGQRVINYSMVHNGYDNTIQINAKSRFASGVYRLLLSGNEKSFKTSFIIK